MNGVAWYNSNPALPRSAPDTVKSLLKVPTVPDIVPPVTLPDRLPENLVVVSTPVLGLYVKPVSVLGLKLPVAAFTNNG